MCIVLNVVCNVKYTGHYCSSINIFLNNKSKHIMCQPNLSTSVTVYVCVSMTKPLYRAVKVTFFPCITTLPWPGADVFHG